MEYNLVQSLPRKAIKRTQARIRWLRKNEYTRLLKHCDAKTEQIVKLLIGTGMRLGEMCSLEYRNVNSERMEIYLEKTKTDAPRTIPMTADVWLQIRLQPRSLKHDFVFTDKEQQPISVRKAYYLINKALVAAKIEDFRPHDLRHTFATYYLQNGGKRERLQKLMGHTRFEQTSRYAHHEVEDLHEDMDRVATKMATLVTD